MAEGMRSFIVWGGGGHGRVVADLVRIAGHRVFGYVDRDASRLGEACEPGGACIVMTEADLLEEARRVRPLRRFDSLAFAIGDNTQRYESLHRCARLHAPALVHPSATVSASASLGPGTVVLARAVVNAAARLGRGVIVNSGAVVEHDCVVADAVHVSPGAVLCGSVRVGPRSWIGAGSVVIQNVRIGCDAMVGAGAVVIRDVPDDAVVVGNPARALHVRAEVTL